MENVASFLLPTCSFLFGAEIWKKNITPWFDLILLLNVKRKLNRICLVLEVKILNAGQATPTRNKQNNKKQQSHPIHDSD